ncbi:hypothetical protein DMC30DRAFT_449188 [Rhodotorula diobovata]|uniref:Uncharacterized protein n=1 Tax=Rhodotorula diobovata TaxID=5288 RepID=A0A5C5FMH6_9BASI|nr:hypothetical protein DMC30DRAFT_449188 [Rhodotorula diobovata]
MRYGAAFIALLSVAALVSAAPAGCSSRQYLDVATGLCKACPLNVLTCKSATVAVTCQRGSYLTPDKKCVTSNKCPQKTFANTATQACTPCYHVEAATCSNASPTGATSCIAGACLSAGTCLYANRLKPGYYCPNSIYKICPGGPGVYTCDVSTGVPTRCKKDYTLGNGGCCPTGTYFDGSTCVSCPPGVTACAGPDPCDALDCGAGQDGQPLFRRECGHQKRRRSPGNRFSCETADNCYERQWADLSTQTCKNCDSYAETCTGNGPGTATSCSYMRYLTTDGNCVLSLECSRRTGYVDGKSCRACGPGALACTGPESATKCGTNSAEDQLYLNNGVCIERAECPDGTFADDGTHTCTTCTSRFGDDAASCTADVVTKCTNGLKLNGGCIDNCPPSVAFVDGDECFICGDRFVGSSTCTADGPTSCGRNEDGTALYVSGAQCVTADECSDETYGSYESGQCEGCVAFGYLVKTCDAQGALSCSSGYLYERGCFAECPPGTLSTSGATCQAIRSGDSCDLATAQANGFLYDEFTSTCVSSCREYSDGSTPGSYRDDYVCKPCASVTYERCDSNGPLGCRAPYVWDQPTRRCITTNECQELDGTRSYVFLPPDGNPPVPDYEHGICTS